MMLTCFLLENNLLNQLSGVKNKVMNIGFSPTGATAVDKYDATLTFPLVTEGKTKLIFGKNRLVKPITKVSTHYCIIYLYSRSLYCKISITCEVLIIF